MGNQYIIVLVFQIFKRISYFFKITQHSATHFYHSGDIYFLNTSCTKQQEGDGNIRNKTTLKKLAEYHFRKGENKAQVAQKLNISLSHLTRIFGGKNNVDNAELLKQLTNYEVENALLKKACGYSYTEVKETEKEKGIEITTTHKEVAPDVSAAKAWLESNSPEIWGGKGEKSSSEEKLDTLLSQIDESMNDEP